MQDYVTNYEEAVELLYRIPRFTSNHSLENIKSFLTRMGQPDRQMKIVHIAGTNGKGSTSAYLAGLLEKAGLKVGLFTSPHLVDIRERFRINGQMISRELLLEAVKYIGVLVKDSQYRPCFFDMMFFIGMYAFWKEQVDILVLETGLGGRLDATNAVSHKALTMITHIALDHTEYLGDTEEAIAEEKAGIMKGRVPCVVAAHNDRTVPVFLKIATELEAPCRILGKEDYTCHRVYEKAVDFSYFSRYYGTIPVALNTSALYQADNAALALAGLEALIEEGIVARKWLTAEDIREALFATVWEGRMEEICEGVFLDGAHNVDGMHAFLQSVKADACRGKRICIFSALADKALQEMAATIRDSGLFTSIIVTQLQDKRGADASVLVSYFKDHTFGHEIYLSIDNEEAIKLAFNQKREEDYIYVVGSLYLVRRMKELLKAGRVLSKENEWQDEHK